jgi:hypothetical protein
LIKVWILQNQFVVKLLFPCYNTVVHIWMITVNRRRVEYGRGSIGSTEAASHRRDPG